MFRLVSRSERSAGPLFFFPKMYYTVRIGFFTKEYIQQC